MIGSTLTSLHGFWLALILLVVYFLAFLSLKQPYVTEVACTAHACMATLSLPGPAYGLVQSSHRTCSTSPAGGHLHDRTRPSAAYVHCHAISLSRAACAANFLLFLLAWTMRAHDLVSLPPTVLLATR